MATLFIHHEVKDFDEWRRAFDDHEPVRIEYGARSHRLFRDPDDDLHITVVLEVEDPHRALELLRSDAMTDAFKKAGVKGEPVWWISEAFEDVTYPRPTRRDAVLEQAELIL